MKKTIFTLMLAFIGLTSTFAQVGIGTTTPAAGAALDITSTNQGLLLPRVADIAAITTPTNGMIIYDNFNKCIRSYENNAWSSCLNGSSALEPVIIQILLIFFN